MLRNKVLLFYLMAILLLVTYSLALYDDHNNMDTSKIDENSFAIEKLTNDIYYFPARMTSDASLVYQPLKQFDFIFTGHDVNLSSKHFDIYQNAAAVVPGRFTHMLMYIGKDHNGFAYALEMNTDKNITFSIDYDGIYIGGGLYLICLGNDFGEQICPDNKVHSIGLKKYDYYWAKQLEPKLKSQLFLHKDQLFTTMKKDFSNKYPFQIPLDLDIMTSIDRTIRLIDDGHKNGSDCISYFISLFEEVAGICFDDIRIDASSLMSYYLNDPLGQRALFPGKYNPISEKDIPVKELVEDFQLSFINNKPRRMLCDDQKMVTGISTPDLFFNSSSMTDIRPLSGKSN